MRLVLVNLGFPINDKGSLDTTFFRSWPLVISWKGIGMMLSLFKVALACERRPISGRCFSPPKSNISDVEKPRPEIL